MAAGVQSNALAEVGLDSGQTIKARLVVGADGARSRTRQLAGMSPALLLCAVNMHTSSIQPSHLP